jgi:WD40 repeat protein
MNELAAELPAAGVVRVVGPEEAGAGFLVSTSGLIVTCAHVLAGWVPGATVSIEPHVDRRSLSATVELLRDPPDVAVLQLIPPVPPDAVVLQLGLSPKTSRPGLRTFGYPEMRPEAGLPGELDFYGETEDHAGYKQLALRSAEATLGFSGAPIWDPQLRVVVGMVKSIFSKDRVERLGNTAIGVPAEVIRKLCPNLRLPDGCPYRGLEPFTEEHVDYYYGRNHATSQLLKSLSDYHFVPVVAISGGGKSSLLQAGLAKGLRDHPVVGLEQRTRCYQRVSGQPHAELLHSLAQHGILLPPELAAATPQKLTEEIRGAVPRAGLIVVVDQFERLYTDCEDAERKRFVALLRRLATDTVKVVIGLRADFYHLALADLGEQLADGQVALAPMSDDDLKQAITAPAEKLLRSFQSGLTQDLIADVSGRPGDLPLLQFALTELWARDAEGGVLTEETYQGLGVELPDRTRLPGAQGALIRRADQLWQDLGPADQQRLQRILLGLIAAQPAETSAAGPAVGTRDLSRPARLAQWDEDDQRLIQRLIDARLLTASRAPAGGQPTVEVSHEALLRAWPRLRGWLEKRSQFVQWRAQDLAPNLERWLDSNKNPEFLLPRSLLDPALRWLNDYPDELAGPPADYVQASKRHRVRRRRLLSGAVAVLVVASLAAAGIFYSLRQAAVSQSHIAQSEEMAAEATNLLPTDGALAMLLSLQAYERAPTLQAESALIQAAQQPLDDRLSASGGSVDSVAFSPDGRTLAAGDAGGYLGLWDVATGRRTATLAEGNNAVYGLAFSPDGRTLAAGDDGGDVGLWDVATGRRTAALAEGNGVGQVAFSPDGHILAAGDYGGYVGLWDVATGRRTAVLAEGNPVGQVAFSSDGHILAAGDWGGYVGLWDVATGRRTAALAGGAPVYSVAFSPDGHTLAAGVGDDVGLWDVATGRRSASLAEGAPVKDVAFSPDGHTLAAGGTGDDVGLWDVATGRRTASLAEGAPVYSVAFSPDGHTLAVGDDGGYVGLWDVMTAQRASLAEGNQVENLAFSPDGHTLAAGDDGGNVGLWDAATGRRTATLAEGSTVFSVAFSPDGHILAAGDDNSNVVFWDVATGRRTATLAEGAPVFSVAFSPDGHILAAGDYGGHVGLWDVATGRRTATLAEGNQVKDVAFSPDGHILAAGDTGGDVGLWDAATGRRTATLAEGNGVRSVAFRPDGHILAAGDYGGYVGLWDVATGRRTATLAEGNPVSSVAFSPDSSTLVTGDYVGNVSIWNAANEHRFASLAEGGTVGSLAFRPHGQVLAIGDRNGNITLLWQTLTNLTQRVFTHLICGKVRGNMTPVQWTEYVPGEPYQQTCS